MSGQLATYLTGANARIKVFGVTLAYATDVSYQVAVDTVAIESMGKFESHDNQPVGYNVAGGFSIVRYTMKIADSELRGARDPSKSNAVANIGDGKDASGGFMGTHFNPAKILESRTFDLDIYQRKSSAGGGVNAKTGEPNAPGAASTDGEQQIMRVVDCRMTRKGMTLSKRGVWVETMSFIGILAQDTDVGPDASLIVGPSGVGLDIT
jgi:hypothetical protein